MAFATDPFTQVHDALWALLESASTGGGILFTARVPVANRIKFSNTTNEDPLRDFNTTRDAPWVTIVQTGGAEKEEGHTFMSRMLIQNYEIQVITGNNRIHVELNRIRWAIVKAVLGANGALTTSPDAGFVRHLKIGGAWQDRLDTGGDGKTPMGWVHFLTVEVWLNFANTELTATDS